MAIKKLILDLDMGVDDAMALAYAIASPEVELADLTFCHILPSFWHSCAMGMA